MVYENGDMFPSWVETLGSMAEADQLVRAICSTCIACADLTISALIKKVGADCCLIDRRPPCFTPGCAGHGSSYARATAG